MTDQNGGPETTEKPKRKVRRKPLILLMPTGSRTVTADGVEQQQTLYTLEQFTSVVDLRDALEARELDQTNAKGIIVLRADPIPVETKMKAQVVIKFNASEDEDGTDAEEGLV